MQVDGYENILLVEQIKSFGPSRDQFIRFPVMFHLQQPRVELTAECIYVCTAFEVIEHEVLNPKVDDVVVEVLVAQTFLVTQVHGNHILCTTPHHISH
jgi:hypothetical protein